MDDTKAEAGEPRQPSPADRPPVSRVGDELQERSIGHDEDAPQSEAEAVERDAFEAAQQKGWDKDVKDSDAG
jgi:hypothetical protein